MGTFKNHKKVSSLVKHIGTYVEQHEDEIDDFPYVAIAMLNEHDEIQEIEIEFVHLIPYNSEEIKRQITKLIIEK